MRLQMGELMKGQMHWVFPSHPPKEKHIYQHKFDYICKVPFSIQGNIVVEQDVDFGRWGWISLFSLPLARSRLPLQTEA